MRAALALYILLVCFVANLALGFSSPTGMLSGGAGVTFSAITSATFGTIFKYNQTYPPQTVNGDAWNTTWDDLGRVVTICNDCSNWNSTGVSYNIQLNQLTNTNADSTTIGSSLNTMTQWNTGSQISGYLNRWNGIISVGGVLYAINTYDSSSGNANQYTQILKSSDHGTTWLPTLPGGQAFYSSPMWPFSAVPNSPYTFVQYGQNYTGNGPDNSNTYIYALVPGPGVARVLISNSTGHGIDALNAADWQWWTGGDGNNPANWSSTASAGVNISYAGQQFYAEQYLPRYGKYVAIASDGVFGNTSTFWQFVSCDHPWGPCVQIGSNYNTTPGNYYLQSIAPNSLLNGGQQIMTMSAGDFHDCCSPTGRYTLTMIPVTLTP